MLGYCEPRDDTTEATKYHAIKILEQLRQTHIRAIWETMKPGVRDAHTLAARSLANAIQQIGRLTD